MTGLDKLAKPDEIVIVIERSSNVLSAIAIE